MSRGRKFFAAAILAAIASQTAAQEAGDDEARTWSYGVSSGLGYFNFRDSLYVDRDPDGPGDLGEDWAEFFVKPWLAYQRALGSGAIYARTSWAYVRTGKKATPISGGDATSTDFDELYLGFRIGSADTGQLDVAGGRLPYELAHSFLINDGYADGGSRGGYWSNARRAWAPAARARWSMAGHSVDLLYLERDERPENDAETTITGLNYEWRSPNHVLTLGGTFLKLQANDYRAHLDGAKVWNARAYATLPGVPLVIETEFVREDNGQALDSSAWYIQAEYSWSDINWRPSIQYRYADFEGDDPGTPANENYDPLFPGFRDWGTWWQGEIAGEYFLSNSNLRTHMLRIQSSPREGITTGLIFFDYKLDQPGSYQGGVSSRKLGQELNWYLDWSAFKYVSLTFVVARNQPGAAVEEAFDRTKPFKYMMLYATLNFER